jgi:CRISPR-associated endonuclease/helicase Cas3
MHVVLVSACEKRAIKRTREILDSYAIRTSAQSWASPITEEGLREIRDALKRRATRQTAVACYRNDGRRRMKLLWIVGSRQKFAADGHFPSGYTARARRSRPLPGWARVAALLAQTAGFAHDWGKAVGFFQAKLADPSGPPIKDPVRHEWLSMRLLHALMAGNTLDAQWRALAEGYVAQATPLPGWLDGDGIDSWQSALAYIVATHHKLFADDGPGSNALGAGNHVRKPGEGVRHVNREGMMPKASIPKAMVGKVQANLERISRMEAAKTRDAYFWRGVATVARIALVLADQYISSLGRAKGDVVEDGLYAKSANRRDGQGQSLAWHLDAVGNLAGDLAYRIATLQMDGLSDEAVDTILSPTMHPRYAWQDRAAAALAAAAAERRLPTLVINLAGTGAGKTRMNAKALCALSANEPVRFATAMNLRTLTLQTGDAYREQLQIGVDEMACVIGDRAIQKLHENQRAQNAPPVDEDEDGNENVGYEIEAHGNDFGLPAWLEPLLADRPGAARMFAPPVLVSTVDTLIKAGEPQHQGHHAVQFLRVASGDLILDELDSYDPDALVAVLRLVTTAGLFGRHVVASSATLPRPITQALVDAFALGVRMRKMLGEQPDASFRCAYIDDLCAPGVGEYNSDCASLTGQVARDFTARIDAMGLALAGGQRRKVPMLQRFELAGGMDGFTSAVEYAASLLHGQNSWAFGDGGKRVSFGLIRVANIRTAIPLARELANRLPHARIACYHSQDMLIQRHYKESRLDTLLRRTDGDGHILRDQEINRLVAQTHGEEVPFIVIATPVEEIGRDHDFDWAVIEPSSAQSIVQAAGRVNRHRLRTVGHPNIAILQYNALAVRGGDQRTGCVFLRPGLESHDVRHPSHDLGRLFDWDRLTQLDARARYDEHHPFSVADDKAIAHRLAHPNKGFMRFWRTTDALWMGVESYRMAELRAAQREERRFRVDGNGTVFQETTKNRGQRLWTSMVVHPIGRTANDWLVLPIDELCALCEAASLDTDRGLTVSLPAPWRDGDGNTKDALVWDQSFGWFFERR